MRQVDALAPALAEERAHFVAAGSEGGGQGRGKRGRKLRFRRDFRVNWRRTRMITGEGAISGRNQLWRIGVFRIEVERSLCALACFSPVVLANGFFRLIQEAVNLALHSLAGHRETSSALR